MNQLLYNIDVILSNFSFSKPIESLQTCISIPSLGSLSTPIFETRTANGSELFSLLTCLQTTTFTFLSTFSPLGIISIKIWETSLSLRAKCSLLVTVSVSKTRVLKLPNYRRRNMSVVILFVCRSSSTLFVLSTPTWWFWARSHVRRHRISDICKSLRFRYVFNDLTYTSKHAEFSVLSACIVFFDVTIWYRDVLFKYRCSYR